MLTDYKITERIDRNGWVYINALIFKGKVTTEDEYYPMSDAMVPVTRYRRIETLREVEKSFEPTEMRENPDAPDEYMRNELAKDPYRDPIPEQDTDA